MHRENNATIFFHGHDHFFGKQEKEGVVYQEVPQHSARNLNSMPASQYGYVSGIFIPSRGYLLVTVTDTNTTVEYIRTYLPSEENGSRHNGDVSYSYTLDAKSSVSTVTVGVPLAVGWNMISNPVTVANDSVGVLYPSSTGNYAFSFTGGGGYQQSYRMLNGTGYWAKFTAVGSQNISGWSRASDSVEVSAGWNMVGSISSTVDTSSITSTPADLRASQWFGYDGAYTISAQVTPGKAYWVKANSSGKFYLSSAPGPGAQKLSCREAGSTADLNALTISDNKGNSQTLYFGAADAVSQALYEMPPLPPAGAFDARFLSPGGGLMVKTFADRAENIPEAPIAIQSNAFPLTVSWNVHPGGASFILSDALGGAVFQEKEMKGEGALKIYNSDLQKMAIKVRDGLHLPKEFVLAQNYPNPFNPSTTIKYELPRDSHVSLKVFNILGQEAATLVNEEQKAGYKSFGFDASSLASGTYFYKLQAGSYMSVKKCMLLK